MDRVAQLAREADRHVAYEKIDDEPNKRHVTRRALYYHALYLGFPENEISAAIDTALKGR